MVRSYTNPFFGFEVEIETGPLTGEKGVNVVELGTELEVGVGVGA